MALCFTGNKSTLHSTHLAAHVFAHTAEYYGLGVPDLLLQGSSDVMCHIYGTYFGDCFCPVPIKTYCSTIQLKRVVLIGWFTKPNKRPVNSYLNYLNISQVSRSLDDGLQTISIYIAIKVCGMFFIASLCSSYLLSCPSIQCIQNITLMRLHLADNYILYGSFPQ